MNGIRLDATKIFTRHRITLPKESQIKGENIVFNALIKEQVQIAFKNEYSRNWNGLYYFHDPEDNEEYIYNCFEPFFANKAFPCFDQPDLKASMRLCTITPEKWLVITNEYYEEIYPGREALSGKLKAVKFPEFLLNLINEPCTLRVFKPTEEISTYLYSITAGPYKEYSGKSEKGLPPLRIFARQAMAKYMDKVAENVFSYTINGLNFFKEFFNSPFPYTKHDQIFIPDFKYDGMEHAGAVLLNEKFIRKDVLSKYDMMSLAETILHQVSHMWFGDLVTLRWWNDLWLNESFAVFMAFLALSKAKGFEIFHLEAWTVFRKELVEAYREDQERTTHPIETPVNNTEEAENLFDSITYWKGASVLKQLYYFLDESVFRQGIMEYFVKYKGKNTDLADFIGCMKVALKKFNKEADLNNWVDLWLTKKGVSQLKPEMKFFNDVITDFNIIQTTSTYGDNVCRMHRLDIALYDSAFTETLISSAYVAPQPSCSIKSIIGKPKPFAVMLNVNDFTYAKVQLDDISLNAFQHCMTLIPNELTKTLIWQSVWDMVRDGLFGASTFLKFVATQIAQENSVHIFNLALDYATVTVTEYVPDKYKPEEASKMFEAIKTRILSEKGVDNKRHLLKHITEFAYTIGSKKVLLDWLKNQESILGIKIPLPIRYEIIKLLYKAKEDNIPMEEKKELLEKELSNDKSEEGVYAQLACTASLPDPKIKEKLWNWYKDETVKESEQVLLASMSSFWCWEQMDILEKYAKEFFGGVWIFLQILFYRWTMCSRHAQDIMRSATSSC
eukprot:TRINITY_DN105231_c1_g1_i1.p1 TRINITY_DN105231_c1_g1~~TRINITY_DN105231_c1_g1_i1.p1  ORF type:complete len:787 (+),score=120.32 TRINITY_DN105231_c1_g1_i1:524-2884(+)